MHKMCNLDYIRLQNFLISKIFLFHIARTFYCSVRVYSPEIIYYHTRLSRAAKHIFCCVVLEICSAVRCPWYGCVSEERLHASNRKVSNLYYDRIY